MIYFIQDKSGGRIKIGTSIRLSVRLKQLCKETGLNLKVLAIVDGDSSREASLHCRFSHLRVVKEWFEPGDDLLGFIVEIGREWDGSDESSSSAVRLEFDTADHERIERVARMLKLSKAGFARMAVMDRVRAEEARVKE